MRKIEKGDVFKIKTKIGYGFLQYVKLAERKIYYIRVLDYISKKGIISQYEVNKKERWYTEFLLSIALQRKIVKKIGNYKVPSDFKISKYARSRHVIPDKIYGWYIVNRKTLKLTYKDSLSEEDKLLSPHGLMNDTYIIERLEEDWSLKNWK